MCKDNPHRIAESHAHHKENRMQGTPSALNYPIYKECLSKSENKDLISKENDKTKIE